MAWVQTVGIAGTWSGRLWGLHLLSGRGRQRLLWRDLLECLRHRWLRIELDLSLLGTLKLLRLLGMLNLVICLQLLDLLGLLDRVVCLLGLVGLRDLQSL